MKKIIRILSVALVAAMVLSMSAISLADATSVYIPKKGTKAGFPDMPEYFTLKTKSNDEIIKLQFSEKPDWAGVNWGSPDWAWENLVIDDSGYAELDREGHPTTPGKYVYNNYITCKDGNSYIATRDLYRDDNWKIYTEATDKDGNAYTLVCKKGEEAPHWLHGTGDKGVTCYTAGKGDVEVGYKNNGVEITYVSLKVEEDFYQTGMEGAVTTITWTPVFLNNPCYWADVEDVIAGLIDADCNIGNYNYVMWDQYSDELVWYVSKVVTTYPEGNYITRIESVRRNDKTNSLDAYTIDYATSENVVYRISYDEDDSVVGGEYRVNGTKKLTSGSGKYASKWFGDRSQGRASKLPGLKSAYSFKSPRIK
jgi:hypothetical protein